MKTCTKCKLFKETSEFSKSYRTRDGYNFWCKKCHAEAKRIWKEKNKETIKQNNRNYYELNKEHKRDYQRDYKRKNRKTVNRKRRAYYEKNKNREIHRKKKWKQRRLLLTPEYAIELKKQKANDRKRYKEKYPMAGRNYMKRQVQNLTDLYIKSVLKDAGFPNVENKELIEIKRLMLKTKREINKNTK